MYIKIKHILVLLVILIDLSGMAQNPVKGIVVEKDSRFPVPFATVTFTRKNIQQGVITDLKGKFEVSDAGINTLTVSCVGYRKSTVHLDVTTNRQNLIIEIQKDTFSIDEVIVRPGVNPANRIITKVLENKRFNNFEQYPAYQYQCYVKTNYDVKLANNATALDSSIIRKSKNLKNQSLFISEAVLKTIAINGRAENRMIASKTSGLKDPIINQSFLLVFHHALSFYNNEMPLLRAPITEDQQLENYVSPLSDGCLSAYRFALEDTIISGVDSVFVLSFFPKNGKNFNSLKGQMHINTNGYAVQSIIAEPSQNGLVDFKFHQEYTFCNGRWFPSVLNEEIGFTQMVLNKKLNVYPVYLITAVIDSVIYQSAEEITGLHFENLYIDNEMIDSSEAILKKVRPIALNQRELKTYVHMDSLGQKIGFDAKMAFFKKLMTGRVPVKFIDIELNKIYNYNGYEKVRLGLGFSTNEHFSDYLQIGLFGGYGFADKKYKYGVRSEITINRYHELTLQLNCDDNLYEVGNSFLGDENLVTIRTYMGDRFDRQKRLGGGIGVRAARFMKLNISAQMREIYPAYTYAFRAETLSKFRSDVIQVAALMGFKQELLTIDNRRYVNKTGNPNIELIYQRGISTLSEASYRFNRYEALIYLSGYRGRLGQSNLSIKAGYVDSKLPYGLLFTGEGSRNNSLPFKAPRSFQTLMPYEFLSDAYVDVFYAHNFGSLLFETPKFKPQVVVLQNVGWGKLSNINEHSILFKTKEKVFLESGLMINNLVRFNYINFFYVGFGGGAFYRYGPYQCAAIKDNLAFKMSVMISFR